MESIYCGIVLFCVSPFLYHAVMGRVLPPFGRKKTALPYSDGDQRYGLLQIIAPFYFFQQIVNSFGWIVDPLGRYIMVDTVNDCCQEFRHICFYIIRFGQKLRIPVIQIGRYNMADIAFFIIFIKFIKSVGKESEGGAYEDPLCSALLLKKSYRKEF